MQSLKLSKIDKKIKLFLIQETIFRNMPCMQILFEKSNENIECKGINLLPGKVANSYEKSPLPHIGWTKFIQKENQNLIKI